jgi:hypothetical protein
MRRVCATPKPIAKASSKTHFGDIRVESFGLTNRHQLKRSKSAANPKENGDSQGAVSGQAH